MTPGLNRAGVPRVDAIDLLRGFVIALMVLDHTRDYFHQSAFLFDPTDPARTSVGLYFTRWVTHLCAPTFVFLAGVSVYLQRSNGKNLPELTRFLVTRGLWLVVLELTLIAFGFNFALPFLFLQVIWAIGISMILLAAIVRLPPSAVAACGALVVGGHQLLAPVDAGDFGGFAVLWQLAFEPGAFSFAPGFIPYPALPWFGVMCLGYGLGPVFVLDSPRRQRVLLRLGIGAIALFLVLRFINGYGDPAPWRTFPGAAATAMSFFNVSKYPPSLLYVLITLGIALVALAAFQRFSGVLARVLLAYGRTPLFTYVVHIYLVHGSAMLVGVLAGVPAAYFTNFVGDPSRLVRAGWGFTLPGVYAVAAAILAALYPLSSGFAGVKRRRRAWWLGYL